MVPDKLCTAVLATRCDESLNSVALSELCRRARSPVLRPSRCGAVVRVIRCYRSRRCMCPYHNAAVAVQQTDGRMQQFNARYQLTVQPGCSGWVSVMGRTQAVGLCFFDDTRSSSSGDVLLQYNAHSSSSFLFRGV